MVKSEILNIYYSKKTLSKINSSEFLKISNLFYLKTMWELYGKTKINALRPDTKSVI